MHESIAELLKKETAADHERLDSLPLMKQLMSPAIDLSVYREIISKMAGCFEAAEKSIAAFIPVESFSEWFYEPKINFLKKDLNVLKMSSPEPSASFTLVSEFEAVGALYVLFGSSLGARFISKHLHSKLGIDSETGLAFYSSSEGDLKPWMSFKAKLNQSPDQKAHEILSGAHKAFGLFASSFSQGAN